MNRYDDIINLPAPNPTRPRMSLENRAAQFASFAALIGFEDEINEASNMTDPQSQMHACTEFVAEYVKWMPKLKGEWAAMFFDGL